MGQLREVQPPLTTDPLFWDCKRQPDHYILSDRVLMSMIDFVVANRGAVFECKLYRMKKKWAVSSHLSSRSSITDCAPELPHVKLVSASGQCSEQVPNAQWAAASAIIDALIQTRLCSIPG